MDDLTTLVGKTLKNIEMYGGADTIVLRFTDGAKLMVSANVGDVRDPLKTRVFEPTEAVVDFSETQV
jgi:hypothetical protein